MRDVWATHLPTGGCCSGWCWYPLQYCEIDVEELGHVSPQCTPVCQGGRRLSEDAPVAPVAPLAHYLGHNNRNSATSQDSVAAQDAQE